MYNASTCNPTLETLSADVGILHIFLLHKQVHRQLSSQWRKDDVTHFLVRPNRECFDEIFAESVASVVKSRHIRRGARHDFRSDPDVDANYVRLWSDNTQRATSGALRQTREES